MALEAVVSHNDPFNYGYTKDLQSLIISEDGLWGTSPSSNVGCENHCPVDQIFVNGIDGSEASAIERGPMAIAGRRKRRRSNGCGKNKEEMENQRKTHIAVERNRRKQMSEYLAVLRSLMPPSYIQRGDQASIVGGAINFVKQLEQLLHTLEAQRTIKHVGNQGSSPFITNTSFTFPYYNSRTLRSSPFSVAGNSLTETKSGVAEVTLVENHANLKILSARRPCQLLKLVAGFQGLHLSILHLNVTTVDQMVRYCVSAKVEEQCQVTTVEEMATAVQQIMDRIQEDSLES